MYLEKMSLFTNLINEWNVTYRKFNEEKFQVSSWKESANL